jgi:hypothetical protein
MLNPFIQSPRTEKDRPRLTEDEALVQLHGQSLNKDAAQPSVGLWVGKLLIRMGEKLTKEDMQLKSTRERA